MKKTFLLSLAALVLNSTAKASVDLHAHLFMEESVPSWIYKGCFDCPLQGSGWEDLYKSRGNKETLLNSELQLVVVALYAHQLASGSLKDNLRAQIAKAEKFVSENPSWVIVKNPSEAEAAMKAGKKSLVLSIEGAAGALDTSEDFREFIDEKGVSIVTLLHFMDDSYGGAGFLKGGYAWLNPLAKLKSLFSSSTVGSVVVNPVGLTDFGRETVKRLVEKKVWVDFSHASDKSTEDLAAILKEHQQPHLYTHTTLRDFYGAERGITADQLAAVKSTGGIVGIIPSSRMMAGTPVKAGECGTHCSPPCSESMAGFGQQFRMMKEVLGPGNVFVGSDINSPMEGLAPGCPEGSVLAREGYWRHDHVAPLYSSLGYNNPEQVLKNFLSAWRRARGEVQKIESPPSKKNRK